jgi:hypothetical protein
MKPVVQAVVNDVTATDLGGLLRTSMRLSWFLYRVDHRSSDAQQAVRVALRAAVVLNCRHGRTGP